MFEVPAWIVTSSSIVEDCKVVEPSRDGWKNSSQPLGQNSYVQVTCSLGTFVIMNRMEAPVGPAPPYLSEFASEVPEATRVWFWEKLRMRHG